MAKKPDSKTEDLDAFREAMKGVKPLTYSKITNAPKKVNVRIRKQDADDKKSSPLSDFETLDEVSSTDRIYYAKTGIQHKILRKFREGQYNAEAVLDLHGMTVEQSRTSLYHFITQCRQKGVRHVLVIHGKGRENCKPILKNKLNHWLRQIPEVIAFSSAVNKHGATGALYVLLRR